jgi:anthranilate phosphoribosyltransferase
MKPLLAQLLAGKPLSIEQAIEAFTQIMTGSASPAQVAALLALIQTRGPSQDELVGAATVMRKMVVPVTVPKNLRVIDTCGTGGTGSRTFNISTTAGLVAAVVARPQNAVVAKHGNRAITSASGSSQVLETLGVKLIVQPQTLTRCLDELGFCFCYAPAHHPAMKHAGPIRAELGFATIFNRLGPLTNPAGATRQVMGVASEALVEPTAKVLRELGAEHALTLNRTDHATGSSVGELLTTGPAKVAQLCNGQITCYELDPASLGLPKASIESLNVTDPAQSAAVVRAILAGEKGPPRDVVLLNAAAALLVADVVSDMKQGIALSAEALDSGAAAKLLENLVRITQADPTPQG